MHLSQRLFLVAALVVLIVVVVYGGWTGAYLSDSILRGVGQTAANSIGAMLSRSLDRALDADALSGSERGEIEAAFDVASSTDSTRLLLLRIRNLDGSLVLQTGNDLQHEASPAHQAKAATGEVTVLLADAVVPQIGTLPALQLPVMKIYTPLRSRDDEIIGVAELFFGARAITALQTQARTAAWLVAVLVGFLALGMVALIVEVTGRVIEAQRRRLAHNLARTRALMRKNKALQKASDALRMDSILANERVLSQVGTDIHDGPVQLLTLLILRMPGSGEADSLDRGLAQQAMEELRAISSGLVLPEMSSMSLRQAIDAAIERHRNLTGSAVEQRIEVADHTVAALTARICAYRVVQEALTNAFRHGSGAVPRVAASVDGGWLEIEVSNPVPEGASIQPAPERLGFRGMRFRVESQGGWVALFTSGGRAILKARMPLGDAPQPLSLVSPSTS